MKKQKCSLFYSKAEIKCGGCALIALGSYKIAKTYNNKCSKRNKWQDRL